MADHRGSLASTITICAAVVLAAGALAGGIAKLRSGSDALEVTGSAKRTVTADYAVWKAAVSAQSPTLAAANAELKRHADAVRAWLRSNGIADSLVTSKPFETEALREFINGTETPRLAGYRLTYRLQVAGADVDQVAKLALGTGELIDQGVPLVSDPLEYLYTGLATVRKELLAEATKDAKERAVAIAGAADAGVGRIKAVRVGVFQVTPRFSTEVSDYGVNDVSAREKDVTAVVRVEFELN